MDHLPDILTNRFVDMPFVPYGGMASCEFLETPPRLTVGTENIDRDCLQSSIFICRPLPLFNFSGAPNRSHDYIESSLIHTEVLRQIIPRYRFRSVVYNANSFILPRTGPPLMYQSDIHWHKIYLQITRVIEDHHITFNLLLQSLILDVEPPGNFEIQFAMHNPPPHPRILLKRINALNQQQHEPPDVLANYAWNVYPPGSLHLRHADFLTSESIHYIEPSLPLAYLTKRYYSPPPAPQARSRINEPPKSFLATCSATWEWRPPPLSAVKLLGILPDRLWPLKVATKCSSLITEQENSGEYCSLPQCSSGTTPLLQVVRKAFIFKEHKSRLFQYQDRAFTRSLVRKLTLSSSIHACLLKPLFSALRIFLNWQQKFLSTLINFLNMKNYSPGSVPQHLNRIQINFANLRTFQSAQTGLRRHKIPLKYSIQLFEHTNFPQFFQTGCRTLSKIGQAT